MIKRARTWGLVAALIVSFALPVWAGNGSGDCIGSISTPSSPTDSVDEDSDRPDYAGPGKDGKPGSGSEEPGIAMGDLYGDLHIIVRDENGEPILYEWIWDDGVPVEAYESADGYVQPIAAEGTLEEFGGLVPLDIEGEIPEAYAEYAQEVDFGRLNVARAPQSFLDRAYAEVLANLNAAEAVGIDPAGRLLLINGDEEKAVDAPRETLALYQKLMKNGCLDGLIGDNLDPSLSHLLPSGTTGVETPDTDDLQLAAALLAAAADKTGAINVDMVIYLNAILGVNGAGSEYVDFYGFTYGRQNRHGQTEADVLIGPENIQGVDWFKVGKVQIMNAVFGNASAGGTNARGFAKASDDALKIIGYIHNWKVPEY